MKLLVKDLISVSGFTGLVLLFLATQFTFAAQELKVGFVQGRGNDAAVEEQAFKNAKIEYEVIDKGDYKIDNLLKYDTSPLALSHMIKTNHSRIISRLSISMWKPGAIW